MDSVDEHLTTDFLNCHSSQTLSAENEWGATPDYFFADRRNTVPSNAQTSDPPSALFPRANGHPDTSLEFSN